MKNIILVILIVLFGQQAVNAQKTMKVFVVRHAEKVTDDPKDKDPLLSEIGALRAVDLMKLLRGEKIDSIFTTDYKRTKLTAFPLPCWVWANSAAAAWITARIWIWF